MILPCQESVRQLYSSKQVQIGLAVVIMVNFLACALETQFLPEPESGAGKVFKVLEYIFNVLFTMELAVNMYAFWFVPFFTAWNIFDLMVVIVSWVSLHQAAAGSDDIPGLSVLRLFRAFRVFRLLKRVKALSLIVQGVTQSIPGVSNACVLLLLVMGIWSIIAVDLFKDEEFSEFFGDFGLSMLSTFQMMTFDSWVSGIARPVTFRSGSIMAPVFFISYAIVSSFMMLNVVVAILLDKFTEATQKAKKAKEEEEADARLTAKRADEEQHSCEDGDPQPVANQSLQASTRAPDAAPGSLQEAEHYAAAMEDRLLKRLARIQELAMVVSDSASGKALATNINLEEYGDPREALHDLAHLIQFDRVSKQRQSFSQAVGLALHHHSSSRHSMHFRERCLPFQDRIAAFYQSHSAQIIVAIVIFLNFLVSAIDAQLLPVEGEPLYDVLSVLEWFFNSFFLVELCFNLYAHWFLAFWADLWNVFDVAIVTISWVSMMAQKGGIISVLRLFRAFRVFRLFKRIEALRIIIVGVLRSLPGVANAFVLLGLIMGIWSIIGVNQFGGPDSEFEDLFGNFAKAMLTMFQIMTFDSWCSGVARPIILRSGVNQFVSASFFISYVLISGFIMANVVLAILLDKFLDASKDFHTELEKQKHLAEQEEMLEKLQENAEMRRELRKSRSMSDCDANGDSKSHRPPETEGDDDDHLDSEVDPDEVLGDLLQDGNGPAPTALLAAEFRLTARFAEVEANMIAQALANGAAGSPAAMRPPLSEPSQAMNDADKDCAPDDDCVFAFGGPGRQAENPLSTENLSARL